MADVHALAWSLNHVGFDLRDITRAGNPVAQRLLTLGYVEWLNEVKHDGYRLITRKEGERVCLGSRNGRNWTSAFPTIVQGLEALPDRVVLDSEAVAHCDQGLPDFYGLRSRYGGDIACGQSLDQRRPAAGLN